VSLVKSKKRVADHGEVFTPEHLVETMIDLVSNEATRIESRFLEPACGSGNFLTKVLQRKLESVQLRYGKNDFERRHYALLAVMSIYGIELLPDNVEECRQNLLNIYVEFLDSGLNDPWTLASESVLSINIMHGDALRMKTVGPVDEPITFSEWTYLGKGLFNRREFRFDTMTTISSFGKEDTLFAEMGKHEIFTPMKDYGQLSVVQIGSDHG
jgi:N-6 DNA Methylase